LCRDKVLLRLVACPHPLSDTGKSDAGESHAGVADAA
jgi:hypothetical protein